MSRTAGLFTIAALSAVLLGCAGKSSPLEGAVYADQVAVYRAAEFDGEMGGTSSDLDGTVSSESRSWFFTTEDPLDEVAAWYEDALPKAVKKVDGAEITFTLVPEGAEPDEEVQVILRQGTIQIHESTRVGKHRDG
jgi:hypothetical protein